MTFHVQNGVPNWLDAVARLPAGVAVKGFAAQMMAEIKAANPTVKAWHRHWNDPYQVVNVGDTDAVREQRARGWFDQFIDGTFLNGTTAGNNHALSTDFISWWNEYYAQSQTQEEKELWWRQERVAARIWRDEYRNGPNKDKLNHIRLTICAAAVGNDIPWQSAETAELYDCVLDYHPYDWWQGGQRHSSSWQFQAGRWLTMDADYKARGFSPQWLFGEGGPYADPVTGWRGSAVCGGSVTKYVEAVKWWIDQCKQTTAYQQGRILGPPTLFTTGGGSQWEKFETKQPEMNAIADMVKANWSSPAPPPPPPPDPDPCQPREVYSRVYVVLPTSATAEQFAAVAKQYHGQRRTIGFSYDDAGHGPGLSSRTAILLGIPDSQKQTFINWYAENYPGTIVQFGGLPSSPF